MTDREKLVEAARNRTWRCTFPGGDACEVRWPGEPTMWCPDCVVSALAAASSWPIHRERDDEESAHCTCEWAHPSDGEVSAEWPAELDPYCRVHGEPNGFPNLSREREPTREEVQHALRYVTEREQGPDVLAWTLEEFRKLVGSPPEEKPSPVSDPPEG